MNPLDLRDVPSAVQLRRALAEGTTSALEIAERHIRRIQALEPTLHAWKSFDPDAVRQQARACDQARARAGASGLLAGSPVGVQDLFDTADLPTGYGSALYEGHRPREDAQFVRATRAAGACIMGKTVSTEFAYFTPGPTANPWNPAHTPGGSSSGSAAAVACGMVPLSLGSQTSGSIIRPAAYCGIFGLKPTFGFIDMRGAKAFSPSLDTVGWFARTADDLELMRCALAGTAFEPLQAVAPAALKIIASRTAQWHGSEASGRSAWELAGQRCLQAGVSLRHAELDSALEGLFDAQQQVAAFEAARSLAPEFREHPAALSDVLRQLLSTGQGISQQTYEQALALAHTARPQVLQWMGDADAVMTLSAPGEAPAGLQATGDPMFNRIWTLLGFPCVNVPGLLGPTGLPVGLQLVGRPGAERALLVAAQALHRVITQAMPGPTLTR
ncbi:MAG: hypothetical protein RIS88_1205 [Pseudomonadota bacterium]|jgi:Asp-tRNA(Asn)/Glu-tRNA(Gln) amidotransferase A subunit family amidase